MRTLKSVLLGAVAAVSLALTASIADAAPTKIRVSFVVPVGNWMSLVYEKKDLMKNYGKTYEVEVTRFQGTTPMITALAANELDIADLAYSSFALAVENAGMKDLKVIADEVRGVASGISEVEIVRARAQHKAAILMSLESSSARCEHLARQLLIYGRAMPTSEMMQRIDAVDAAALGRVASRIVESKLSLAALGLVAALPLLNAQDAKKGGGRGMMSPEQRIERLEEAVGKLTDTNLNNVNSLFKKE